MLVQLSDPHVVAPGRRLLGRIDTPGLLAAAVASVQALSPAPAAVLVSGDLVEAGSAEEYAHLRALLAPLPCPVWLMPGNHDDVTALRAAFPDHAELQPDADPALAPFVLWDRRLPGLRVLALDSVVPGRPHGALCAARLDWLARRLAEVPTMPTLVALHHPPFASGIEHMDAMALRDGAAELERLLSRHPQVERLVCGHLHRATARRFGGTLAVSAPSTAHQIVPDLSPGAPAAWQCEPPGFLWHVPVAGALVTHTVLVGPHRPNGLY